MGKGELISVVVPIYNVEAYLTACIDSILQQTYKNIEIILVDDGSTDSCPEICDRYSLIDPRVHVIHKKNGGLSDARNAGLHIAEGSYICFFDSDDVVSINIIEKLYRACTDEKADMAVCYYQNFVDSYQDNSNTNIEYSVSTGKEIIKRIYQGTDGKIAFVAWNKLYKIDLFREHGIGYPIHKQHEDTYTTYKLLFFSEKVCIVESELYFYRLRSGSIMNSGFSEKRLDALEARSQAITFFMDNNEIELQTMAANDYFGSAIKIYEEAKKESNQEKRHTIQKNILNAYKKEWHDHGSLIQGSKRVIYGVFTIAPVIISKMYLALKRNMRKMVR